MNEQSFLRSGETVLWQGKTKPFGVLDGKDGKAILKQWIIGAVIVLGLIAVYYAGARQPSALPGCTLLAVLAAMIVIPFVEHGSILGQRYYLTSERAVLVHGKRVSAMERADIDVCRAFERADGSTTLAFGEEVCDAGEKSLRHYGLYPATTLDENGKTRVTGMSFFGVDRAQEFLELMKR